MLGYFSLSHRGPNLNKETPKFQKKFLSWEQKNRNYQLLVYVQTFLFNI